MQEKLDKIGYRHLKNYLDTDVKVNLSRKGMFKQDGAPLLNCVIKRNIGTGEHFLAYNDVTYSMANIELILRPLSDLNKEIKHGNKKFVPIEEIYNVCTCDNEREYFELLEDGLTGIEEKALYAPYTIIEKLFEWGFDVFGLIEMGLAKIKKEKE